MKFSDVSSHIQVVPYNQSGAKLLPEPRGTLGGLLEINFN